MKEVTRHLSLRVISILSCYCHPTHDNLGISDPNDGAPLSRGILRLPPLPLPDRTAAKRSRRPRTISCQSEGVKMKKPQGKSRYPSAINQYLKCESRSRISVQFR